MTATDKRPIAILSIDAKAIYDRIIKAQIGDTVTYEELGLLIGRDVQRDARGFLHTARKRALRDNGMVFSAIPGIGVKRLSDIEVAQSGEYDMTRIRRLANRGKERLTLGVADFAALPNDAKVKHNAYASMFGVLGHITKSAAMRKIEAGVEKAAAALPLQKTLEAFSAK